MTREEEKKNERLAALTSIALHAGLLLLFFFMVAWRPPNPPLPEVGLEINFGMDDQGTGKIQPEEPVGSEGTQPEEPNQPEEEMPNPEPQEPVETKVQEDPVVTTKEETPVRVEDKKEEKKQPDKPIDKPEPKKEEPKKTEPKPDPKGGYTNPTAQTDAKAGSAGSQGDDVNKAGDKGQPDGTPDPRGGFHGTPGGGGGPRLEMSGWQWDSKPNPEVPKSESGRIVFQIKVDENGEIIDIKTLERGVSVEAEKACRAEIQRLTFTKTGSNVPEVSIGKITFVITSR
jgi:periplasmic protein TonB